MGWKPEPTAFVALTIALFGFSRPCSKTFSLLRTIVIGKRARLVFRLGLSGWGPLGFDLLRVGRSGWGAGSVLGGAFYWHPQPIVIAQVV